VQGRGDDALFVLDDATSVAAPGDASQGPAKAGHYVHGDAAEAVVGADFSRRDWRRGALVGAVAVVVTGAIVGAAVWWTTRPAPPRVLRTEITSAGAAALSVSGVDRDLAITPDGSRVVYRGNTQLFVRALDQLEPDVLSGLGVPRGVFASPDGQWVGFFDGNPLLKKVAVTGGPPVTITRADGAGPRGATSGPDGTIVYATNAQATGLQRVSAAGGDPTVLTKPNRERGEVDHLWPEFLPGGQAALFTITAATGGLANAQIAVLELETGTYKVLVRGGSHAHYVPTGHLVYGAGGTLRAVAFDLDRLEAVGTPVPVLEQVVTTAQGAVDAAIAANGTMAYVPGGTQDAVVWVDRQLREEPTKIPPGAYMHPRLSPDGQKVALSAERANGSDVWVYDFRRATFTRLTFEGNNTHPVWTPDGARIAFSSSRAGATRNIYWLPVDGSAAAERLTTSSFDQLPADWAPDGKTLMFSEFRPDSSWDIWTLSTTDRKPQLFLRTPFHDGGRAFSPDGRWVAYYSDESGQGEVHVRPFPGPGPKWQISTEGGAEPVWAPSGRELFYRREVGGNSGNRWMVADVQLLPAFSATAPRLLFEGTYKTSFPANFDVSPDGRRFIMIKPAATAATSSLVVVQNWTEELKRRVPTSQGLRP
jgi:serine/threonine-protein kinase